MTSAATSFPSEGAAATGSHIASKGTRRGAPREGRQQEYHEGWDHWIVENLARGVSRRTLAARLVARGFGADFSTRRITALHSSPAFKSAVQMLRSLEKTRELLNVLGNLQACDARSVAVVDEIDPGAFYEKYVFKNEPVVLRGLTKGWRAMERWTPRYFAAEFGHVDVEITADRELDARFEENFAHHVRRCRLDGYVKMIEDGGETNDYYLVSKNRLLGKPALAPALADFMPPPGFVDEAMPPSEASLWLGPGGTVTPLHHDACNILFSQIFGRKRVRLIAPLYLPRLCNTRTCFTSFDPENPDWRRFPGIEGVPIRIVELGPGDTLFIPVGWWHHVRALSPSISLSFTRFKLPRNAHVWTWRSPGGD